MPPEQTKCGIHDEAIANLKHDVASQWEAIDKLRNRLPVWATVVISILTFTLGFTLNYAVMASKMTAVVN